jgi:hypothetical protein
LAFPSSGANAIQATTARDGAATRVIVETAETGERLFARIVDDSPDGPLWVQLGPLRHVRFALTSMLQAGCIVEAAPDERALLEAFGIATRP